MFKQYLRIILLAIAIMVLDDIDILNRMHNVAYAADDVIGATATHANCAEQLGTEIIAAITGGVVAALATLVLGYTIFISPDPFSKPAAIALIASGVGALTALIIANAKYFACAYTFVRHPVLRDANGNYMTCENPEQLFSGDKDSGTVCKSQKYKKTNSYDWPKNETPYSDFIEFCYRKPMGGACIPEISDCSLNDREYEFDQYGDVASGKDPNERLIDMKERIGGGLNCATLEAGEVTSISTITFSAYQEGGSICLEAIGSFGKKTWPTPIKIGCHLRTPSPPGPMCGKSRPLSFDAQGRVKEYDNTDCFNCYISPACYSKVSTAVRAPTPMTSVVVQCVRESLNNLLTGTCSTMTQGKGFLGVAQARLKDAVMGVLALAVALFGIKMMMGHAIQGPSEYFMLLIKFALVIYFAIGNGMAFYYNQLVTLSVGLSDLVLSAGGNSGICNYKTSDYMKPVIDAKTDKPVTKSGTNDPVLVNYSYLAPWDRLDCRIFFYLGSGVPPGGAATASAAALVSAAFMPAYGVIVIVFAALASTQLLLAIVVFFFIIMLLLVIIWIVHLFILSLIALTIISLFAPLFVPMVLFQATKGFFDGWLRQLTAFSIYPIVLFAFLSLVFSVFDKMYFGDDLEFKSITHPTTVDKNYTGRIKESFILKNQKQCDDPKVSNTMYCTVSATMFSTKHMLFGIKSTELSHKDTAKSDTREIWRNFGMMGLMAFLFYHFLSIIGGMAAELSGSFRADISQGTMGPKEMASKLQAGAMKTANMIGGGARTMYNDLKNKGGSNDQGKEEVSRSVPNNGG